MYLLLVNLIKTRGTEKYCQLDKKFAQNYSYNLKQNVKVYLILIM